MKPGNLMFLNLLNFKLQSLNFQDHQQEKFHNESHTCYLGQNDKNPVEIQPLCDQLNNINMKPGNLKFLNVVNFKLQSLNFA